jgi:hypothetical protein
MKLNMFLFRHFDKGHVLTVSQAKSWFCKRINLGGKCISLKSTSGSRIGSLGNIIFDILEPPAVQKYSICWVFLAFRHKLYLCICEFEFVYLCIWVFDSWEYQFWCPWTLGFSSPPFGIFPKIHPFWWRHPSLRLSSAYCIGCKFGQHCLELPH